MDNVQEVSNCAYTTCFDVRGLCIWCKTYLCFSHILRINEDYDIWGPHGGGCEEQTLLSSGMLRRAVW
jgi:hypothetical protein